MNIQQLPNTYYFWILPEESIREELYRAVENVPENSALLVSWNTYIEIRHEFSKQLRDRDFPDWNCLDICRLKLNGKAINIMVTR